MQINSNLNVSRYTETAATQSAREKASTTNSTTTSATDSTASFAGADALEGALSALPDVRTEAVARAKALISDPNYPSNENLKRLSQFLAKHLTADPTAQP